MTIPFRKVPIDECLFFQAIGRDLQFHDTYPQSVYLDVEEGELTWVYDDDEYAEMDAGVPPEVNAASRETVTANPIRHVKIRGLEHGDHHDILKEFLDSGWTNDDGIKRWAKDSYFSSIGGWIKSIDDDKVAQAYYDFRDQMIKQRAEQFLDDHGIEPQWK